jgi:hypothetical protein
MIISVARGIINPTVEWRDHFNKRAKKGKTRHGNERLCVVLVASPLESFPPPPFLLP